MDLAMFYYVQENTNAHGRCDRQVMSALCDEHDITVFAWSFDNPRPDRIRFVRVPIIPRPLFLQLITFRLIAGLVYRREVRRRGRPFDRVAFHEVDLPFGDVSYTQFCNRAYLAMGVEGPSGLRGLARLIDHRIRAFLEPRVFARVPDIVVPSAGLARELRELFGDEVGDKVTVISNFVQVDHLEPDPDFDRAARRAELGFEEGDLVLLFIALGHFERKGLPPLLEALRRLDDPTVKLLTVGGTDDAVAANLRQARQLGLGERVTMVPTVDDLTPMLWAADVFAFPSHYETFAIVAYEAAAAGLPLLATPVHGVEDLLVDGVNGWRIEPDAEVIAERVAHAAAHRADLPAMGAAARSGALSFGPDRFDAAWKQFYDRQRSPIPPSEEMDIT